MRRRAVKYTAVDSVMAHSRLWTQNVTSHERILAGALKSVDKKT
jgi:hypothetical protein